MAYGTIAADVITGTNGNSFSPESSVFRNRIINGAMVIDQRNAGASVTQTNAIAYTLDRWRIFGSVTSKFTVQQNAGSVTPPDGFRNYLGVTSSAATALAASDAYRLEQPIEGFNVADLGFGTANAKTITASFWVRSSLTGTFGGALWNVDATRAYVFSYTISSANTWEYKTITIAGDTSGSWNSTNGQGLVLQFSMGAGSDNLGTAGSWGSTFRTGVTGQVNVVGTNGATFYITGVQLEVGSTATSFDYRPYGTELALCQRYYVKTFAMSTVPANGTGDYDGVFYSETTSSLQPVAMWQFPVNMRAIPTITTYNMRSGGTASQWTNATSDLANVRVVQTTERQTRIDNSGVSSAGSWHINAVASIEL